MKSAASEAAERVARLSYGKLIALLASRSHDVASAEDALSAALMKALEVWPNSHIPENPEGWLLTTARHIEIDRSRRVAKMQAFAWDLATLEQERIVSNKSEFPDERLKLLFVCAHPAIDVRARTPLMLQTVLGIDARRIASAFLTAPTTMGQRLSRAKAKIKNSGIRFEVPSTDAFGGRLNSVLDAIYAAYTVGWDNAFASDIKTSSLSDEAIWLARLIVDQVPSHAEALGLLSLMLFSESRRFARRDIETGSYIPIVRQDVKLWSMPMIEEAENLLRSAGRSHSLGRYQLEAAIQAVHAHRCQIGGIAWHDIAQLYLGLIKICPTVGAKIGYAVAISEIDGPSAALEILNAIPQETIASHQPYWAAQAHILARLPNVSAALSAYDRAIGLAEDIAVRLYLDLQKRQLLD